MYISENLFPGATMKLYQSRRLLAYLFVGIAIIIVIVSLILSNLLVKELSEEERNRIRIWASATELLASGDESADMSLVLEILQSNTTIPVILYDENTGVLSVNNIALPEKGADAFLMRKIGEFSEKHDPIKLEEVNQTVYYDDSHTLKKLQVYPYIQLVVMAVFIVLAFYTLGSTQKAEQNKVWVGLSKETAHQLGTPISSLMAWTEYLKLKETDPSLVTEIEKDVNRLQMIAERFSKIGSASDMKPATMQDVIRHSLAYMEKRISNKIVVKQEFPEHPARVCLNEPLFAWVIENLVKNAVDAMNGQGTITLHLFPKGNSVVLDVTDMGKGIPKSKFKSVFYPGFTTKERGWGLGLSLAKRIVETYHKGRIFVKQSEAGKGTTFRIVLRKAGK